MPLLTQEKQRSRSINDFANRNCYTIHANPTHIITWLHQKHKFTGNTRPFLLLNNKKIDDLMTWHECILEWHGMTVTLLPIYAPIHYQIICLYVGYWWLCLCDPTDSQGIVIIPFLINQNKGVDSTAGVYDVHIFMWTRM